jgi:hypothetical protein
MLLTLEKFRKEEHFSDAKWHKRGLSPPGPGSNEYLQYIIENCASELIKIAPKAGSERKMKQILKRWLLCLKASDYEREEQQYICEVFSKLADIIMVNPDRLLDSWMYGVTLSYVIGISRLLFRSQKELRTE